jgi:hypothetical protein
MPFPLAGTITLAAAGVGAAALVVALALPVPPPAGGTWADFPTSGTTVAEGLTSLTAHASAPSANAPVTEFRFELTDAAGTPIPVMTDQHPIGSARPGSLAPGTLYYGRHLWQAVPGQYTLVDAYLAGGSWTSAPAVHFTVPGHVPTSTPTPTPTPTPAGTPTPGATPTPTPSPSSSQPSNPSAPPAPPAPTGQVQILSATGTSGYKDVSIQAFGITPVNAVVDVQVQLDPVGAPDNPDGTWLSQGCSDLTADTSSPPGNYTCSVEYDAQDPYGHSAATGWVRVQVTVGDQQITSYAPTNFTIQAPIH